MTLSVSGTTTVNQAVDDTVTVTHFSLDSWGQIEQKTTPLLSPKVTNQSQNPFNPFMNNETLPDASTTTTTTTATTTTSTNTATTTTDVGESFKEEIKIEEDKKTNTNPFIDANPFFGLLNPFKDLQPTLDKKIETDAEKEKSRAKVIKTEEIQTTTTTLTHKVSFGACKLAPIYFVYIFNHSKCSFKVFLLRFVNVFV